MTIYEVQGLLLRIYRAWVKVLTSSSHVFTVLRLHHNSIVLDVFDLSSICMYLVSFVLTEQHTETTR